MPEVRPRAIVAGPGAMRTLREGGSGRLEVALGPGGYVRLGACGWCLVTGPRAPVGPLSLLVAGLGRRPAAVDWEAHVEADDLLVVGPHRIAIDAAWAARPRPRPPRPPRAGSGRDRAMAAALAAGPPRPAALLAGLTALEQGALAPAVELLAGRGEGLTPAGDDVLAGYASWALAAGEPVTLSVLAASRCSPIGLAYLRCAERGELPAPATAVIDAVLAGDVAAAGRHARALRAWGSSSGGALVWGMAAALRAPRR